MIEGKMVLGAPREIQEVKNAFAVYEQMDRLKPTNEIDLLKALLDALKQALKNNEEVNDAVSDGVNIKLDDFDRRILALCRDQPYITQDDLRECLSRSVGKIIGKMSYMNATKKIYG